MHLKFSNGLGNTPNLGTRVILVRHAQSNFNAQGRYQGRSDEPVLTEKGRICARDTGVALQGLTIDAIYTSPLQRVIDTASEILEVMSTTRDCLPKLQVDNNLREIDMPIWQGLPFEYVREQFAEDYRCWKERPHEFQVNIGTLTPNPSTNLGEGFLERTRTNAIAYAVKKQCFPVLDLYEQARQFWQEILPLHAGETVLVISHSGTNRALISTAIGLTPDRYNVLQQSNCGISVLNFPTGWGSSAQLQALNLTTHLGETLPKLKEGKQGLRLLLVSDDTIDLQQVERLAEYLKPVSIDFSLSSSSSSQETTERILQYHPMTVQLQVLRQDFPEVWQRTIQSRHSQFASSSDTDSAPLITGLVVGCDTIIKSILGKVLGISSDDFWRLHLKEGALSVIHYPKATNSPVLQAMNICEDVKNFLACSRN